MPLSRAPSRTTVGRSIKPEHRDYRPGPPGMGLIERLQGFVATTLGLIAPAEHAWQPTDSLPDLTAGTQVQRATRSRASARHLSDNLVVVLVCGTITRETPPRSAVSPA